MTKATRAQLAMIHIAKKDLGLDEETYRAALRAVVGKGSAALLEYGEAASVISHFTQRGWKPRPRVAQVPGSKPATRNTPLAPPSRGDRGGCLHSRFEELRNRPGMATPQEMRKIEAMWAEVARGNPQTTLRNFLFKRWQVSDMRFLTARQAWGVIEAVKAIHRRRMAG